MRSTLLSPRALVAAACAALGACAPKAVPLRPAPVRVEVPRVDLPIGHEKRVFRWTLDDAGTRFSGEGVVRIASPDSARIDVFLDGGLGGGWARVVGNDIHAPGGALVRRVLPPPPLLWAALGRLAVPAARDTVSRVDGDTVRADIGLEDGWRITIAGGRLLRVDRVGSGRLVESVVRPTDDSARYVDAVANRVLVLTFTTRERVAPFDPAIWIR